MKMKMTLMGCAAGLAAALFATPAATQNAGQDRAAELCTPDVMRLCNEFVPDVEKITACMSKKRRQLSAECRTVFNPPKRRRLAP
jgi:hypothetical protein